MQAHHTYSPEKALNLNAQDLSDELRTIAQQVVSRHRDDVVRLACLLRLWQSLVQQRECAFGLSLAPISDLQTDITAVWMRERGITSAELASAMHGMEQAGATLEYLDSLPG